MPPIGESLTFAQKSWEEKKLALEGALRKLLKRNQKRHLQCMKHLQVCRGWNEKIHEAELLQANIYRLKQGMEKILVSDWELNGKEIALKLNPRQSPQEQIAKCFKAGKKLKIGVAHAERRLQEVAQEEEKLNALYGQLSSIDCKAALEAFIKEHPSLIPKVISTGKGKQLPEKKPYREFITAAKLLIRVGKSARDNEVLTFSIAHGSDWWLHAKGYSGSHVILRAGKNQEPDQESLQDALQLAIYYSKAKEKGEGEVCLTQRKYVSRFGKGKAGRVAISKHKDIYLRLDMERIRQIQTRKSASFLSANPLL